ncbi:MAG: ABC transporter ATP-binding protein [Hydrogenibacillus sp.]|nr:ABC transporter ATP-binding protein [Hydrogenibacillus sp.]
MAEAVHEALLVGDALAVSFGGRTLFRDLDWVIRREEVWAVIGPNGSGKTTLLQVLAGLRQPEGGKVWIAGRPLTTLSRLEAARRIAYVPQSPADDALLPVREVLALGRLPHHRERKATEQARICEAAERFGLMGHLEKPFAMLSGGEKRRVLLARAWVQEPDVLLLDEPLNDLDVQAQCVLLREMRRYARAGRAVVAVFHDVNAAALVADRILLLGGSTDDAGLPRVVQGSVQVALSLQHLLRAFGQPLVAVAHPEDGAPQFLLPAFRNRHGEPDPDGYNRHSGYSSEGRGSY